MRVICEGLDLSDAVITVSKAIVNKTINPILEGIKLVAKENYVELTATNLELTISKKIKADVIEEGELVVPGIFFSNYIRSLTGEQIELQASAKNLMKIIYTDSQGEIQCYKASEFPELKTVNKNDFIEIGEKELKDLINKVIFSVAMDDSRPILKGVLLEVEGNKLKGVALDGYRLAYAEKNVVSTTSDSKIIVPANSLIEISKLLDTNDDKVKLFIEKNLLFVEINGAQITSRLIDGEFINYKQIIPNEFKSYFIVSKNQLEKTLERAGLLAKLDKNNTVKLEIKENNLLILSNSEIGNIKENLNINLEGEDLTIAFNTRYITDILRVNDEEFIKFQFNTPFAPCIIKPIENENVLYLILPVRIIK